MSPEQKEVLEVFTRLSGSAFATHVAHDGAWVRIEPNTDGPHITIDIEGRVSCGDHQGGEAVQGLISGELTDIYLLPYALAPTYT